MSATSPTTQRRQTQSESNPSPAPHRPEPESKPRSTPTTKPQRRSFSLHDLDTLINLIALESPLSPRLPPPLSKHLAPNLSSTSSITTTTTSPPLCPLHYPHEPSHAPPHRITTPPGLPRFGTKEAQQYRLIPPSAARGLGAWTAWASNVSVLRVAPVPGPLVRADDGTWVRGKFPARNGAHGVGVGGLGARASGLGMALAMDEFVRGPGSRAASTGTTSESQIDGDAHQLHMHDWSPALSGSVGAEHSDAAGSTRRNPEHMQFPDMVPPALVDGSGAGAGAAAGRRHDVPALASDVDGGASARHGHGCTGRGGIIKDRGRAWWMSACYPLEKCCCCGTCGSSDS